MVKQFVASVKKLGHTVKYSTTYRGVHLGTFTSRDRALEVFQVTKREHVHKRAVVSFARGEITERVRDALLKYNPPGCSDAFSFPVPSVTLPVDTDAVLRNRKTIAAVRKQERRKHDDAVVASLQRRRKQGASDPGSPQPIILTAEETAKRAAVEQKFVDDREQWRARRERIQRKHDEVDRIQHQKTHAQFEAELEVSREKVADTQKLAGKQAGAADALSMAGKDAPAYLRHPNSVLVEDDNDSFQFF